MSDSDAEAAASRWKPYSECKDSGVEWLGGDPGALGPAPNGTSRESGQWGDAQQGCPRVLDRRRVRSA